MGAPRRPLMRAGAFLGRVLAFVLVSCLCGVLAVGLMAPAVAASAAAADGSARLFDALPGDLKVTPPAQVTRMVAADGSLIATLFTENRTDVPLSRVSPYMRNAVVAIEDYRFYEHGGIDLTGILRALAADLRGDRQGASTLTQQYVANVLNENRIARGDSADVVMNGQKDVGDKLREMKLAIALEKKESKDEILQGYLNIVPFAANAYGVQAAARYFYSKDAADLTLPQAALLAGLVNGPGYYDPTAYPDRATARRGLVLDAMLEHGYISQDQHDAAAAAPLKLKIDQPRQGCPYAVQAPYFCDWVLHQVLNDPAYGDTPGGRLERVSRGGMTIRTTLDPRLQAAAQAQVDATAGANPDKWGASLVTVQPGTGKVLAMAQNSRMLKGQGAGFVTTYNFNVDRSDPQGNPLGGVGGMQPGSTMKPVTLAAWLDEGKPTDQVVDASRRVYPADYPWRDTCGPVTGAYDPSVPGSSALQNDEPGWYRPMTVREGIYQSINTATFASAAGLDDFCDIQRAADAVGLHDGAGRGKKLDLSVLGNLLGGENVAPLAMADAFATFAAGGTYCAPVSLAEVDDAKGKKLGGQAQDCHQGALSPGVAAAATSVLQDVLAKGSGLLIPQKLPVPAAAKTGTNQYNNQTWVLGYTKGLATASFFGDPFNGSAARLGRDVTVNGRHYAVVDGAYIAGPQWAKYMQKAAPLYDHGAFPRPPRTLVAAPTPAPPAPMARPFRSIAPQAPPARKPVPSNASTAPPAPKPAP